MPVEGNLAQKQYCVDLKPSTAADQMSQLSKLLTDNFVLMSHKAHIFVLFVCDFFCSVR